MQNIKHFICYRVYKIVSVSYSSKFKAFMMTSPKQWHFRLLNSKICMVLYFSKQCFQITEGILDCLLHLGAKQLYLSACRTQLQNQPQQDIWKQERINLSIKAKFFLAICPANVSYFLFQMKYKEIFWSPISSTNKSV